VTESNNNIVASEVVLFENEALFSAALLAVIV
jgi:hypothetical protein